MQIDITLPRRFFLISVLASEESRNTMEDLTDAERAEEKIKNRRRSNREYGLPAPEQEIKDA